MGAVTFWWLLLFAMILWMTVKTARVSGGLAVLVFLFWPAALLVVIKHWGDPDGDVRIPFAIALVAALMAISSGQGAAEDFVLEQAPYMTDADIESIRMDNPELAEKIVAARESAYAGEGEYADEDAYDEADEDYAADDAPVAAPSQPPPARPAPVAAAPRDAVESPTTDPAEPAAPAELPSLASVGSRLSYRLGRVPMAPAQAELALPSEFRFAPTSTLYLIAKIRGLPLDSETLGWVVHRDVDMGQEDAWFIEVRFRPLSDLDLAPRPYAERVGFGAYLARGIGLDESRLGEGPFAPAWSDASQTATVSVRPAGAEEELLDAWAVRPVPGGVLLFVMRGSDPSRHELGLRATRLIAGRVQPQAALATEPDPDTGLPPILALWLEKAGGRG